jgi:hypothetical protein
VYGNLLCKGLSSKLHVAAFYKARKHGEVVIERKKPRAATEERGDCGRW